MDFHAFKLRIRRLWRKRRHQAEDLSLQAEDQFDKNFIKRLGKFRLIWRFAIGWVLLFVLITGCLVVQIQALRGYYETQQPVAGGIYSEGIEGSFTNANPLYATSEVDSSVSNLLFAGLLQYDNQNHLVGDLADRWSVSADGEVYTVHLRPNLTWQDGQPLTAADVVFTYQTIQNPDAQSSLLSSWQGIKVAELNERTITFTLPNPLSSFPYSLTNGIVPQHILGSVNPAGLRSDTFNTSNPVGAGPFRWSSLGVSGSDQNNSEEQISLVPFKDYWAGAPKLNDFNIYSFTDSNALLAAYRNDTITAMVAPDGVPADIAKDSSNVIYNLPLTAATMVFFKTTSPILQDVKVRQVLVESANRSAIISQLGYAAVPVDEPLLIGQLGYNPAYAQATNTPDQAKAALDADGWKIGPDGMRYKNGQPLAFDLYAAKNSEYAKVANLLHNQWKGVGIDARIHLQQPADFQGTLSSHAYDAVLYGISIGVDPDVYVYWDSAQSDAHSANRLNFSEYKSDTADTALSAGRTRLNAQLRVIKYQPFLQAWQADAPALGLYQPSLFYVSHTKVYGLSDSPINSDVGRFDNVHNWAIHTGWAANT